MPQEVEIHLQWGVRIPLRDGVHLNATIYHPAVAAPTPLIFTMTPYIADSYHPRANYFARQGYRFALVDCRGRGNSEGSFEPFLQDGQDASDAINWFATQSWCDGQIGMWGGSYGGFNQWMAVKEFPPPLKTIVPAASAHTAVDFPFVNNMFYAYEIQWLTLTSGVTGNANLFAENKFWVSLFRRYWLEGVPFTQLDQLAGNLTTHFQTWLKHPEPDAYWQAMWLTPDEYARLEMPILSITGANDDDQLGALHYYRQHMRHGSETGKARHYLVIGPWNHAGTRTPSLEFDGLKVGAASLVDLNQLHLDWYNWAFKNTPRPEFLKERVTWYLMGADEWRYSPSLEAVTLAHKRLFLHSQSGEANDVFRSGELNETPPLLEAPDEYMDDPLDLREAELRTQPIDPYLTDQSLALNLYGAGLVYHSQPFKQDTDLAGFVRLQTWLSLDVPDADFFVALYEILPDGSSIRLAEDCLRARYRVSFTEARLVEAGEILPYTFERFNFFARRVGKGSRLRLLIRAPYPPYFQKNYHSGGVVADESAQDARTAHVSLYHDERYPSYLDIPIAAS